MFCGYTVRNDIVPSGDDGETATERSGGVHQKVAFGTDDVERRETSRNDVREHGRSESRIPSVERGYPRDDQTGARPRPSGSSSRSIE